MGKAGTHVDVGAARHTFCKIREGTHTYGTRFWGDLQDHPGGDASTWENPGW